MAEFSKFVHVDLNAGARKVPVEGGFFKRDALANRLGVIVSKDHEPVTLTGIIKGFVKYPPHDPPATGTDVTIYSFNGTIDPEDPSRAYVDLPAEAYYYNGPITVAIRNDVGDKRTVLVTFTGYVSDSTDGTDGVPPHSLPDDIDQFISYLSQLETDIANVQTAAAQATRVNITQSKTDRVITVQTRGRTEAEDRTTTITEPTATLSKEQDGPYTLSVTDATGMTAMTIPDPAAEVKKKVNRTSVTAVKTAYSEDGAVTVDDALDEPAKLTLSLEPKQDLHGYTHPWVGGAGKNLFDPKIFVDGTRSSVTVSQSDGGKIHFIGRPTAQNIWANPDGYGLTLPAGTYTISGGPRGVRLCSGRNTNPSIANTSSSGQGWAKFTLSEQTDISVSVVFTQYEDADIDEWIMLVQGDTVSEFEPYENICPITGFDTVNVTRTGKNLLNAASNVRNFAINGDGVPVTLSGSSYTQLIPVTSGAKYTFSFVNTGSTDSWQRRIHGYDTDGNWLRQIVGISSTPNINTKYSVTASIPSDVRYVRVSYCSGPSQDVQFEFGPVATSYEPFGIVTSLPISASAGSTIYGGTVTVNEDGSGTVVVDRAIKYVEDLADSAFTSVVSSDGVTRFWIYLSSFACYGHTLISDFLKEAEEVNLPPVGCFRTISTYLSSINCAMPSSLVGTTLESVRSYFKTNKNHTDNYFVAFFITPLTYSLTAAQIQTLIGTNHIWTDSGCEFTLDYHTDKYGTQRILIEGTKLIITN